MPWDESWSGRAVSPAGVLASVDRRVARDEAGAGVTPIITVENLVKRYRSGTTNAVDGISFTVAAGEFFTLLGPNGAGKTTTISVLTTTLTPTAGSVVIAGHDVVTEAAAVRRNVGIIFQQPSLDQNLTAEENVRFHAVLYGLYPFRPSFAMMPREYRERVHDLAAIIGIERELMWPIKTFSGGMKRKLEIVRSLMHRPRVLFLDEPTVGLDPASRRNLWRYLTDVRAEHGVTVFLTTHYLDEAEQSDDVRVIKDGQIVAAGAPARLKAELLRPYLLVDAADREGLGSELRALGVAFTEGRRFRIELDGHGVHDLLRAVQTPLTHVQTHDPTLEDAYLAIVEEPQT